MLRLKSGTETADIWPVTGQESIEMASADAGLAVGGRSRGEMKFESPLEDEFRQVYALRNRRFRVVGAVHALLLLTLSALLDWRLLPDGFSQAAISIKHGIMAPILALLLIALQAPALNRLSMRLVTAVGFALSVGTCSLLLLVPPEVFGSVVLTAHGITIYLYLLLGLRILPSLVCAMPMLVILIWAESSLGLAAWQEAYDGVLLAFTNVFCALSSYRNERSARSAFLERQLLDALHGVDPVTGIANERSFARHFRMAGRQASRDHKCLALLRADLPGIELLRGACGEGRAREAERRVAHAILAAVRRPLDFVARLEPGQFAILLYDPELSTLQGNLRRLRDSVALLDIETGAATGPGRLGISLGAALSSGAQEHDAATMLEVAAAALEEASVPDNQGIAVRAAIAQAGSTVTWGPWIGVQER
jgi:GGDEF domain-containing protein